MELEPEREVEGEREEDLLWRGLASGIKPESLRLTILTSSAEGLSTRDFDLDCTGPSHLAQLNYGCWSERGESLVKRKQGAKCKMRGTQCAVLMLRVPARKKF